MRSTSPAVAVIAHRGASAYAAEHTVAAYDLALSLGADVLEIDVRATADGHLVALHDKTLARTAADARAVSAVTLRELRALAPEVRPLTLDAILGRYGASAGYLLDLKDPRPPMESAVARLVARHGLRDAVQVQSFDRFSTRRARRADERVRIAQLYRPGVQSVRIVGDLRRVAGFACTIGPPAEAVDAPLVAAAHAAGLRVQPYTVNDAAEMERLLDLGVDGLITDRPDDACAARSATAAVAVAAA